MGSRIVLSRAHVLEALRRAPPQPLRAALLSTLQRLQTSTRSGRSVLSDVLGRASAFTEWEHYPPRDAVDAASGFRFYYHAHEQARRARGEHGHFHVFAARLARAAGEADYAHLFAISVDARGLPLRVFCTNRWVTAEHWEDADWVLQRLRRLDLSRARPRRVAGWVQDMAHLFAPQIEAVVRERDRRIAQRATRRALQCVLEDRRTHVVAQCPVDLARQFDGLRTVGIA